MTDRNPLGPKEPQPMNYPANPVRVSRIIADTVWGYQDYRISKGQTGFAVHYPNGDNIRVGSLMAGREAITCDLFMVNN